MAYTWTNGEVITAEKLNQTGSSGGGGIFKVTLTGNSPSEMIADKTNAEIYAAYNAGLIPVICSNDVNLLGYLSDIPLQDQAEFIWLDVSTEEPPTLSANYLLIYRNQVTIGGGRIRLQSF